MSRYQGYVLTVLLFLLNPISWAQAPKSLIADSGFERVGPGGQWQAFEQGYDVDAGVRHGGTRSIKCVNATVEERRGAAYTVTLNQTAPAPLLVTGWSRAENVGGVADGDYAVYVDLTYQDGTPLWGQTAAFAVGTHGWQRQQVLIMPAKPLKSATIYALFRHHAGTVWFDDFQATALTGNGVFDSQPLAAPRLPAGQRSGWFVRDVVANSPVLPADGADARRRGLRLDSAPGGPGQEAKTVRDLTGRARAVTVYYVERFDATRPVWWNDIRQSAPTGTAGERANLTRVGDAGANGLLSLYPFGCVTGQGQGRMIGVPPLLGPRIVRIGYHAGAKLLYVAFDVALTGANRANRDAQGHGAAKVAVCRADVDPAWGFRAAAAAYYKMFPEAFQRRATAEGIWMPFTDPGKIPNIGDFGIAYHEGDNSVASDDALHILSFRYSEPMTWWMPMPKSAPRTYEAALAMVNQALAGTDATQRRWAQALVHSGSEDAQGRYNVQFQNTPWADGAVWTLNPNPSLPHPPGEWTKARLVYDAAEAEKRYGDTSHGALDGEYLDSIEGWADVLDFRPETLVWSPAPPTFATDSHQPTVPTWFSVCALASAMGDDLHRRGKLLMANSTPWRFWAFLPLVDVAGTETNWLAPDGTLRPDADVLFNLRRTLCYHKPYLLLQNTDFDKFDHADVEAYFQRSLFYGVFPSMFSVNAADKPYWENAHWYERDRDLFRKYIPVIKRLSAAGWEPVTDAHSDNASVWLERYGREYLTVLNDAKTEARATITLDRKTWGRGSLRATDAVTGQTLADIPADASQFTLILPSGETRAVQVALAGRMGRDR